MSIHIPRFRKSLFNHRTLSKLLMTTGITIASAVLPQPSMANSWEMGDPIVSYWAGPMPITDFDAKQMSEGNWNLVPVTLRGLPAGMAPAKYLLNQLDILHKYHLRGMVTPVSNFSTEEGKAALGHLIETIKDHPAIYCYSIRDEPGVTMFPELSREREFILERDPNHMVYINLYPIGASEEQLGIKGDAIPAYKEYIQQYIESLHPSILSYDHYHFGVQGDGKAWFLNLAMMRQAALDAKLPFMVIFQACSWTVNMRIPTGEELRWLTYTVLAYGGQGIAHYVYGYPGHDGGMAYPAGTTGSEATGTVAGGPPTPLYYYARELNREFVTVAKELRPFRSLGAYHVGTIPEGATELPKDAPFHIEPPFAASPKSVAPPGIKGIEASSTNFAEGGRHSSSIVEGFLIGTFGEGDKPTHALLVNLDYRTYFGAGHKRRDQFIDGDAFKGIAARALVGPGKLETFDPATGQWTPLNSNEVKIRLAPGAGLLVRLAQ